MKKTNKNYHHGNLKEELIINALDVIQEKGEESLTLKLLADRLNVSTPSLYRHFSSKEELIETVINHGFNLFDKKILDVDENENYSCLARFYFFGKAYIDFAINNTNLFKIMYGKRFSSLRDIKNRDEAKGLYIILDRILEGQKNNVIKQEDPLVQISVIHSTVHGMATLYMNDYDFLKENLDSVYDTSFEVVMSGLMINPKNLKEEIIKIKSNIN